MLITVLLPFPSKQKELMLPNLISLRSTICFTVTVSISWMTNF